MRTKFLMCGTVVMLTLPAACVFGMRHIPTIAFFAILVALLASQLCFWERVIRWFHLPVTIHIRRISGLDDVVDRGESKDATSWEVDLTIDGFIADVRIPRQRPYRIPQ